MVLRDINFTESNASKKIFDCTDLDVNDEIDISFFSVFANYMNAAYTLCEDVPILISSDFFRAINEKLIELKSEREEEASLGINLIDHGGNILAEIDSETSTSIFQLAFHDFMKKILNSERLLNFAKNETHSSSENYISNVNQVSSSQYYQPEIPETEYDTVKFEEKNY